MTKLTFQMTADEFYEGWKYKLKKNNIKTLNPFLLILILIIFVLLVVITKNLFYLIYLLLFGILIVLLKSTQKKNVKNQYFTSPTVSGEATLFTYGEGLEIINSYQKMFVPWQSIFSVKETEDFLIIMPTYRTNAFVINKERYNSSELNEIIAQLKQKTTVEEVKK